MSESYPRSNAWPFVLTGIVLFGAVLVPPNHWLANSQQAMSQLSALFPNTGTTVAATQENTCQLPKTRVVVGYDPRFRDSEPSSPRLRTASNSATNKATIVASPTGLKRVYHSATSAQPANNSDRYVWQPARDWVPKLIDPASMVDTVATKLVAAPISKAVAKRVVMPKPELQPPPGASHSAATKIPTSLLESAASPTIPLDQKIQKNLDGLPASDVVTAPPQSSHARSLIGKSLQEILARGASSAKLRKWCGQLEQHLAIVRTEPLTGTPDQRKAIASLERIASYPVDVNRWSPQDQQTYWRIRYAVQRRTDVWNPLLACAVSEEKRAIDAFSSLQTMCAKLATQLEASPETKAWSKYLQLGAFQSIKRESWPDGSPQADHTLAVLRDSNLSPAQLGFLSQPRFRNLESALRDAISSCISAEELIQALERYEDAPTVANSNNLVSKIQRFGTGPSRERSQPTLRAIDSHYRNANFRVAVSEDLLNRSLPAFHQYAENVNDTILGAAVRGKNSTLTNLSLQLLPDANAIRLGLLANGLVDSDTASRKGPVVVYNQGKSRFAAGKELVVSKKGIFLGETETRVSTGNRLVGMKTDLDGYPFLGWIVRNIAQQQHDDQRAFLRAEVKQRVRSAATRKLDIEVNRRLANVEERLQSNVVEPLRKMQLDPRAMEMRTTAERVIMRTRLAGPLQLGSNSPRPRVRNDSQLSLHLHQSAANNLVRHLELQGRRMTLGELAQEMSERIGVSLEIAPQRKSTIVRFADHSPLEFRFAEGKIQVTIHFAELDNGRDHWRDFSVRGYYRADVRRLDVELIRDGSVELLTETKRLRDQLALRSIFTKVFTTNKRLDLLRQSLANHPKLQNLAVSQLTIRDGWLAIALSDQDQRSATMNVLRR